MLSIHDFVRIDLPMSAVVGAFTHYVRPELLGRLVIEAWDAELSEVGREIEGQALRPTTLVEQTPASIEVFTGAMRARQDSVVIPVAWRSRSSDWIPPLQADLELAAFGPRRTHLHLLGFSELPPGVRSCSFRASLDHRLTVAFVRHVLGSLASELEQAARPTNRTGAAR